MAEQKSFARAVYDGDIKGPDWCVVNKEGKRVAPGNQAFGHTRWGRAVRTGPEGSHIGIVLDYQHPSDMPRGQRDREVGYHAYEGVWSGSGLWANTAAQKAAHLIWWLEAGGDGEWKIDPDTPNLVDFNMLDGSWYSRGSRTVRDFIGGLLYFDALRLEEETGYRIDASVLLDHVVTEFTALRDAA